MNIPDNLIKSWAIAQKANPSMIQGLMKKDRDLKFCKRFAAFLSVIAWMLFFSILFIADIDQSDKWTIRYVIGCSVLVAMLCITFRPRFAADERTILNSLNADFKALINLVKIYKISPSRLFKYSNVQSMSLEKEFHLNTVDVNHADHGDFVLKTMRSMPASWCWLALRNLAIKIETIDHLAMVVKECGKSADKDYFKKNDLKSSIEAGIITGRKFLLFSKFVSLGAFFEKKGPGGLWL